MLRFTYALLIAAFIAAALHYQAADRLPVELPDREPERAGASR